MAMRSDLKERAITLRKEGKTYREIRSEIPIAKSTLSDWLRSVGLSKPQQQRITQKRLDAALRGAQKRRDNRLKEIEECCNKGIKEIGALTERELWLIGVALYWAEGSKQTIKSKSAGICFVNTDPRMLRTCLAWLRQLGVKEQSIRYDIYIHIDRRTEAEKFRAWWMSQLNISNIPREHIYFKKGNIQTKRSNVGDLYHGLLRIRVKESTSLNR